MLCVHTPEVCKREAPWAAACHVDSRDKEYDIFSSFLLSERTIIFCSDGGNQKPESLWWMKGLPSWFTPQLQGGVAVSVLPRVPCVDFVSHMFVMLI